MLFTDGASNSVPGNYDAAPGHGQGAAHVRLPEELAAIRTARPGTTRTITGLYDTATGTASPSVGMTVVQLE